jgi:SET domain-containing protein
MTRKRPFRVGRARTGLGLFATQAVRKPSRIVEYKGRKLPNDEAEKLEARGNRYLYEINSRWTVDGSSRRNLGRYANHSCRPNAESYVVGHRVFLRAIKNIKSGDEITYDYGADYLNNVITRRRCKCDKCRKKRADARARLRAKARRRQKRARRNAARARLAQRKRHR